MSTWYETKEEDINFDHHGKEVDIYVCDNEWGAIYKTLTFDQIKELHNKITSAYSPDELLGEG